MSIQSPWLKKRSNQYLKTLAIAVTSAGIAFTIPQYKLLADDEAKQAQQQKQEQKQEQAEKTQRDAAEEEADREADRRGYGESPALGVIVGSCPGNAVCVRDTVAGSPADEAGLQEGDYILSINDKRVSSPGKLRQMVERMKAGEKVKVTFWRQGREMTEDVTLASKADQPPASHRAWFGVMLIPSDKEGIDVARVLPGSPAAKSGLDDGDKIVKLNDKDVKDVQSFIECIEDLGPGADVTLIVERDGEEKTLRGKLGEFDEAPMAFLRQAIQSQMEDADGPFHPAMRGGMRGGMGERMRGGMGAGMRGMMGSQPMDDDALDELRSRVRELEKQVQELQGQDNDDAPVASDEDDLTHSEAASQSDGQTLVVQRSRSRSGVTVQRYPRNVYGNWNPYRSGYRQGYQYGRAPLSRSPGYGNSYYRYGGRPYYYGGYSNPYRYGSRIGGVRLGPNTGLFW